MIGLKSMLSCLVGASLILIQHMICYNTSASIDNLTYFLLYPVRSVLYCEALVILNPGESIPAMICLVPLITMNDEIIFSSNALLILPVNFCNVVK